MTTVSRSFGTRDPGINHRFSPLQKLNVESISVTTWGTQEFYPASIWAQRDQFSPKDLEPSVSKIKKKKLVWMNTMCHLLRQVNERVRMAFHTIFHISFAHHMYKWTQLNMIMCNCHTCASLINICKKATSSQMLSYQSSILSNAITSHPSNTLIVIGVHVSPIFWKDNARFYLFMF